MPLAPYAAVSVRVISGDTLVLRNTRNQDLHSASLAGIAAPLAGQPYSADAATELRNLVEGHPLVVSAVSRDEDGLLLIRLCVSDQPFFQDWRYRECESSKSVNRALARDGLVWSDPRQQRDTDLHEAERQARVDRIGLWQQLAPIPPWQWEALPPTKKAAIRGAEYETRRRQLAGSGVALPGHRLPGSGVEQREGRVTPMVTEQDYYWYFLGQTRSQAVGN